MQVILNWRLRSTAGWNMHNVALDFGGGMLSLVQLLMDGAYTQDWTAVTGAPGWLLLVGCCTCRQDSVHCRVAGFPGCVNLGCLQGP